eukprot:2994688-Karenia_brevis.AAC.1
MDLPALSGQAWAQEQFHDGKVIVYTDGASKFNQLPCLRHAGYGAFWAIDHPVNISEALDGAVQTNQRAELRALLA